MLTYPERIWKVRIKLYGPLKITSSTARLNGIEITLSMQLILEIEHDECSACYLVW